MRRPFPETSMDVNDYLPSGAAADSARALALTDLANGMQGSRILAIAGEVRAAIARGEEICNLTVGDFSPAHFQVPPALQARIAKGAALHNVQDTASLEATAAALQG